MEKILIYTVLLLTLLGTSLASGKTIMEGVNTADGAEESFPRRLTLNDDFSNKTATIELHLTSIDMLVSVRVDSVNKLTNVITSYKPGNVARNEMEPEKGKEKVASNHSQNTSITNMSLPRPKSFTKEQSIPSETAANSSSLLEKAWNGFSSAMESFIKWLCFGIEWPKDINSDMFARRTAVTGADLTCPADGSVNDSMFNLDITEMEDKTCFVTSRIPRLMDVASENSEVTADRATNKASSTETDGSMSPGTRHTATDVKENEPSKRHKPFVVFIGHSEHEWPELLPQFVGLHYNPEVVSASPLQRGNDDILFPDSLEEAEGDSCWPELSEPEFATVGYYGMLPRETSGENNRDNTNVHENLKNPAANYTGLIDEIPFKRDDEPCGLKNAEDGNTGQIDPVHTRNHTLDNLENTVKCAEGVEGPDANHIPFVNYSSNGNYEDLACANHLVHAGYRKQEDDNGVCIGYPSAPLVSSVRDGTPLKATRVKKAKDKRMTDLFIDENVFCLAGKNQSGPETHFCTKKAVIMRRSSDSSWFNKWWNRSLAIVGWHKTKGVPLQVTRVDKVQDQWTADKPINESVMCRAGSEEGVPEMEFCAADSPWLITKLWYRGVTIMAWVKEKTESTTKYHWTRFQIIIITWTWQDTLRLMIAIGMTEVLFQTIPYINHAIKQIIRQLRLWRERRQRKLEEERERLRQLELERERATQPTKKWRPKPPKKKRPNYCGRLQRWN